MVALANPAPNLNIDFGGGAGGGFIDGALASSLVAQSRGFTSIDVGAIDAAMSSIGGRGGDFAGAAPSDIGAPLTPVQQGQLAAEADIIVTAERRPVSDAEIAAYDSANQDRPVETVAFARLGRGGGLFTRAAGADRA
jgi:hypothetical protein